MNMKKRLADMTMSSLKKNFIKGRRAENLVRQVLTMDETLFDMSELDFFRDVVENGHEDVRADAMRILCHFGVRVSEFEGMVMEQNANFVLAYFEIAEVQKDADSLLIFLEENGRYLNRAITSLKKMERGEMLVSLFFSNDIELADRIRRIVELGERKE